MGEKRSRPRLERTAPALRVAGVVVFGENDTAGVDWYRPAFETIQETPYAFHFLLARARQCQRERGMLPNILAVDFARTGDVVGVAAALNGLAAPGDGGAAAEGGTP